MTEPLKLFFSYSHRDEPLRDELAKHLKILEREGLVSSWHDRKILAGDIWDDQITINQETADIILLLISADFIASRYCWDIEITRAMALHESGNACVIPVLLRSVDWTNAPFSKLQAVPQNAQPVTHFSNQDVAFEFITKQVRQVATKLIEKRKQQQKEAAIAAYRQQFQTFAADSEISLGERFILKSLQTNHGLTDQETQDIELAIYNPALKQEKINSYRQLFLEAIAQYDYPFNERVRQDLQLVQNHLELSDVEVDQIEEAIVTQTKLEQKEQQPVDSQSNSQTKGQPLKYQPKHDPLALRNWLYCFHLVQNIAPELGMLEPKPPKALMGGWIDLKPTSAVPTDTWITYKTNRGYVDFHVKGMAESISIFEDFKDQFAPLLTPEMSLEKTGKSAAIRIKVPLVNFKEEFSEQESSVESAIYAAKRLYQWGLDHFLNPINRQIF